MHGYDQRQQYTKQKTAIFVQYLAKKQHFSHSVFYKLCKYCTFLFSFTFQL